VHAVKPAGEGNNELPLPAHALTFIEFAAQDFPETHFANGIDELHRMQPFRAGQLAINESQQLDTG